MGALVGFVSEDTENFLFWLTYTQKNATAFGKIDQNFTESAVKRIRISHYPRFESGFWRRKKKILAQYSRGKLSEEERV